VGSDRVITLDEIDWTDDLRVTWHGQPVSGEVVELDDEGRTVEVVTYAGGIQEGPARRYHPNGRLESEHWYEAGVPEGLGRTWYAGGQPRSVARYEHGRVVEERAWAEDGTPLDPLTGPPGPGDG
jgi:antitoxin component YwqK of YwqJK toxin-antitoxin module